MLSLLSWIKRSIFPDFPKNALKNLKNIWMFLSVQTQIHTNLPKFKNTKDKPYLKSNSKHSFNNKKTYQADKTPNMHEP